MAARQACIIRVVRRLRRNSMYSMPAGIDLFTKACTILLIS
jgi:hypothetical protein